ncbi:MAG TPA: uroporphyrinogen-III C-methyltransferase [Actinomycetota bacterium]|nr:uroporphyrinogen-III C-methyltransferase [Actinomycetota bacterium]
MTGTVYLIGAGPGAPDLLTLRAARLLAAADIVFHDALVHPDTLALAERAEKIAVGKRCGKHSTAQRFINKRLVDAARNQSIVVRLKGGDPMLFGRAQEELAALEAAGVRYEVVPGVTAALAAAAALATSLTQRGLARSVAFVTPRVGEGEDASDWVRSLINADAGAIYMGARQAAEIAKELIAAGKSASTPVAIVENASLAETHTEFTTLATLSHAAPTDRRGPAVILIGPQFRARDRALGSAFEERGSNVARKAHG